MTIPLTPVSIDICRHFVFFIHVNFEYWEFRHFEKVIFCLGIWQALCVSIFSTLYSYPQRRQYRFNSRLLLFNAIKKKKSQQQQQEKQQKTKTNKSSLPPWKNISGIHYLIHLRRTLLLRAMKKNKIKKIIIIPIHT